MAWIVQCHECRAFELCLTTPTASMFGLTNQQRTDFVTHTYRTADTFVHPPYVGGSTVSTIPVLCCPPCDHQRSLETQARLLTDGTGCLGGCRSWCDDRLCCMITREEGYASPTSYGLLWLELQSTVVTPPWCVWFATLRTKCASCSAMAIIVVTDPFHLSASSLWCKNSTWAVHLQRLPSQRTLACKVRVAACRCLW